jgi:hypothetical protein
MSQTRTRNEKKKVRVDRARSKKWEIEVRNKSWTRTKIEKWETKAKNEN